MKNIIFFIFFLSLLFYNQIARAEQVTINVLGSENPRIADPFPTPTCNLGAPCTLRAAINFANQFLQTANNEVTLIINDPLIQLSAINYSLYSDDNNQFGDLDINFSGENSHLLIQGNPTGSYYANIKSPALLGLVDRVFDIHRGNVTLERLELSLGVAPSGQGGGCVRVANSATLLFSSSKINTCSAVDGGGIENTGTTLIDNSFIFGNRTDVDYNLQPLGNLYNVVESRSQHWYQTSSVTQQALYARGGGIANLGGYLEINSSMLKENNASRAGGGISNDRGGRVRITNSYFLNNKAIGHAWDIYFGVLSNSVDAYPVGSGGGLSNSSGGDISIEHSAFIDNLSSRGAGVSNGLPASLTQPAVGGGILNIKDTVFENNNYYNFTQDRGGYNFNVNYHQNDYTGALSINCWGNITSGGYNLYTDSSCNVGPNDILDTSPVFARDSLQNTHHVPYLPINQYSIAIDHGSNDGALANDIRSFHRPYGSSSDIGPYEWAPQVSVPSTSSSNLGVLVPAPTLICSGASANSNNVYQCCQKLGYTVDETYDCCTSFLAKYEDLSTVIPRDVANQCTIPSFKNVPPPNTIIINPDATPVNKNENNLK